MNWTWELATEPNEPQAAIGIGATWKLLLDRLLALPDPQRAPLTVTANGDMLAVIGAPNHLPWAPGVRYAAPCMEAPALWLPTTHRPSVPADLLARAILRLHDRSPILLWPDPSWIIPLDRQLPVTEALLKRIKRRE